MKTKIIFLSMILLQLSANVFAQKQTASEFVASFYEFHRMRSGVFNATEIAAHKRWLSPDLYELFQYELKREAEYLKKNPTNKPYFGDGFSFTPLEECFVDGKEIKNVLKISKTTVIGNKTLVEVKFYRPKACAGDFIHAYKIELLKNKKNWLINDLIYLNDETMAEEGRLTADLKREKY